MTTVMIGSYLEQEHVESIRGVGEGLRVLYREDLVPPPRWPGDHAGPPGWRRTEEGERELLDMLGEAEVLYDFPRGYVGDLLRVAPKLEWVQGSMAGAGEVAEKAGLLGSGVIVTTASGVYSGPLAEFVMMAILQHAKELDRLREDKAEKRWRESHTGTLIGKIMCVVGMGSIGRAIAQRARPFGVKIVGVKRDIRDGDEAWDYADDLHETGDLHAALAAADYIAVTLPLTPETSRLIDREAVGAMKEGAYFANVGRGKVVDEGALAEALGDGRLSGAALDVFEEEPLPQGSPLWGLANVIISPHSADNVPGLTNGLQADLFGENLRRYLAGEPLLNVLDKGLRY